MEIVKIKTSKIVLNDENPRTIKESNFQKLINSVKEFPEMLEIRPIVVDENMVVLGGNMRFRACLEAGMKEVSVIIAKGLTEEQKREFIIKDNVSGGDWNWDILINAWNVEELKEWGLEPPIFKNSDDKDISDSIESTYRIEIIFKDEQEQQNAYNKFIEENYECRLLTL
jgi:ParB-like chromosome segregation protein Spo0J